MHNIHIISSSSNIWQDNSSCSTSDSTHTHTLTKTNMFTCHQLPSRKTVKPLYLKEISQTTIFFYKFNIFFYTEFHGLKYPYVYTYMYIRTSTYTFCHCLSFTSRFFQFPFFPLCPMLPLFTILFRPGTLHEYFCFGVFLFSSRAFPSSSFNNITYRDRCHKGW